MLNPGFSGYTHKLHLLGQPNRTFAIKIFCKYPAYQLCLIFVNLKIFAVYQLVAKGSKAGDEFSSLHSPLVAYPLVLGYGH